jgi:hypothetical protein
MIIRQKDVVKRQNSTTLEGIGETYEKNNT